jgi:hydroxyquinol 1,2-dioxygenase
MDGTVGDLIDRTSISHFRPAHVHFLVTAPGFEPLITHLFEQGSQYLDSNVVFGTKEQLVVPFVRHDSAVAPDGSSTGPWTGASYDFVLQPTSQRAAGREPRTKSAIRPGGKFRDV